MAHPMENEGRQPVNMADVVSAVQRIRPTWDAAGIRRELGIYRSKWPSASIEDVADMAMAIARDTTWRTPGAFGQAAGPSEHGPQLAFAGVPMPAQNDDQPSADIECEHGVSLWARTKTGEPQCPYCRGVTRAKRNRFVPGFKIAGHKPCAHDDDVPASIDLDDPVTVPAADEPDLSHEGGSNA